MVPTTAPDIAAATRTGLQPAVGNIENLAGWVPVAIAAALGIGLATPHMLTERLDR